MVPAKLLAGAALVLFPCIAEADGTFTAFGPEVLSRQTAAPVVVSRVFSVRDTTTVYRLQIANGDTELGLARVSSAEVWLNGERIFGPRDFSKRPDRLERQISVPASNEIRVELRGEPGSGLSIEVIGEDCISPVLEIVAPTTSLLIDDLSPEILIAYSDATAGIDRGSLAVTVESTDVTTGCVVSILGAVCESPPLASGTQATINAQILDRAGNEARATFAFTVIEDLAPPEVTLEVVDGSLVGTSPLSIRGTVVDDGIVERVTVNGRVVDLVGQTFAADIELIEGSNQIVAEARDSTRKQATAVATVVLDTQPPVVRQLAPAQGLVTHSERSSVTGSVFDPHGVDRVLVDAVPAVLDVSGRFEASVPLAEGDNHLVVSAVDTLGNLVEETLLVVRRTLPSIRIDSPQNLLVTRDEIVEVSGTVGEQVKRVEINGHEALVGGGSFSASVPLVEGRNTISAVATDSIGRQSLETIMVTRDQTPPRLFIETPIPGATLHGSTLEVRGTVVDHPGPGMSHPPTVAVNGSMARVEGRRFALPTLELTPGANLLEIVAVDEVGNEARQTLTVHFEPQTAPRIEIVSGDAQSVEIGADLPLPLVVRLVDSVGQPVPGQPVVFEVIRNDGALPGGRRRIAVETDLQGLAATSYRAGSDAGLLVPVVEARSAGFAGPVLFTADVTAGPPAFILTDSGSEQRGLVGSRLLQPLSAVVLDRGFNRLGGVPVIFRVSRGGGHFRSGAEELTLETGLDGRAATGFVLGPSEGVAGNVVEAVIDGAPEVGFASFVTTGLTAGEGTPTSVSGLVLDNVDEPVPGVAVRVLGTDLEARTDEEGFFRLSSVPAGLIDLEVDGTTATRPGTWPKLEFELVTVPGREATLGRPVYLLPLAENGLEVSETEGGVLTLPEVPGFSLEIAPGSATFPDGGKAGVVTVTQVHADKVPMAPTLGLQPRFVVTIQPVGTQFDPPARLTLPNSDGLPAGRQVEMYSFDHDLGTFVEIGLGTVSPDGSRIVSNPGVGVLEAGWHCGGDPAPDGTTYECPTCQTCDGDECVADDSQVPEQEAPDDCRRQECRDGSVFTTFDTNEIPPQVPGNCRAEICVVGGSTVRNDLSDAPPGFGCCGSEGVIFGDPPDLFNLETECCIDLEILPKMPIQDLEACPDRQPKQPPVPFDFDGCTVPPEVVTIAGALAPHSGDKDNPAGGSDTQFSNFDIPSRPTDGPCDGHDACYQSCLSDRQVCDDIFLEEMRKVCDDSEESPSVVLSCFEWDSTYYDIVRRVGGGFWEDRQKQVCNCC